jgi:hypothetical protein
MPPCPGSILLVIRYIHVVRSLFPMIFDIEVYFKVASQNLLSYTGSRALGRTT